MAWIGLDVEQVRGLAQQLHAKSQEINTIAQQLNSQLTSVTWQGPDAERFRSDWNSQYMSSLRQVAQALEAAGTAAGRNASEQEQASNG